MRANPKPMRFEFEPKSAALNMRMPQNLLDAMKSRALAKGIPYTRYVRLLLENDVARQAVPMAPGRGRHSRFGCG